MNRCVYKEGLNGLEFSADAQEEREGKWDKRIMYYNILNDCRTLTKKEVRKALNLSMTTWDIEIDIIFKPIWFNLWDSTPDIRVEFRNSVDDSLFKDRPGVLAYAFYPEQGSVSGLIVFNNDYIWSLNGKPISVKEAKKRGYKLKGDPPDESMLRTYNIIHTLIHELGHMLGLNHDAHDDSKDVMDAFYNGKHSLSDWDLYRILLKYNRRIFSRWSAYARLKRVITRMKARL